MVNDRDSPFPLIAAYGLLCAFALQSVAHGLHPVFILCCQELTRVILRLSVILQFDWSARVHLNHVFLRGNSYFSVGIIEL